MRRTLWVGVLGTVAVMMCGTTCLRAQDPSPQDEADPLIVNLLDKYELQCPDGKPRISNRKDLKAWQEDLRKLAARLREIFRDTGT
ncbi:MAG: hypothetical protein HYY93_11240 [Planctomycetes bacterium]|nr:hypothetical protein [Planctomycetota bacterium]